MDLLWQEALGSSPTISGFYTSVPGGPLLHTLYIYTYTVCRHSDACLLGALS